MVTGILLTVGGLLVIYLELHARRAEQRERESLKRAARLHGVDEDQYSRVNG